MEWKPYVYRLQRRCMWNFKFLKSSRWNGILTKILTRFPWEPYVCKINKYTNRRKIIAQYRLRQRFPGNRYHGFCGFRLPSAIDAFFQLWNQVTWSFENLIQDSYSAPVTKNSERFQPFKLDFSTFVGFLKKRTFTFRGWNGILEFESRRNKSSTYFSFRTGKYFASQEAAFLLSRIKNHSWSASKCKKWIQKDHFHKRTRTTGEQLATRK